MCFKAIQIVFLEVMMGRVVQEGFSMVHAEPGLAWVKQLPTLCNNIISPPSEIT